MSAGKKAAFVEKKMAFIYFFLAPVYCVFWFGGFDFDLHV
jgi:hypothetical protein